MEYEQTVSAEPNTDTYTREEDVSEQPEEQPKIITDPVALGEYAQGQGVELGDEFTYNDKTYVYHELYEEPHHAPVATDVDDVFGSSSIVTASINLIDDQFFESMKSFELSTHSEMRDRMLEEQKDRKPEGPNAFWDAVQWLQALKIIPYFGAGGAGVTFGPQMPFFAEATRSYFDRNRDEIRKLMGLAQDVFHDEEDAVFNAYTEVYDQMMVGVLPGRRNALRTARARAAAGLAGENMADYYKKQQIAQEALMDAIYKAKNSMGAYRYSAYGVREGPAKQVSDYVTGWATRLKQSGQGLFSNDKYVQNRGQLSGSTLTKTYTRLVGGIVGILGAVAVGSVSAYNENGVGFLWNDQKKMTVAERAANVPSKKRQLNRNQLNNDKFDRADIALQMVDYKRYGLSMASSFKSFRQFGEDEEQQWLATQYAQSIADYYLNMVGRLQKTKMSVLISKAKQTFLALDEKSKLQLCSQTKFQKACSAVDPLFEYRKNNV